MPVVIFMLALSFVGADMIAFTAAGQGIFGSAIANVAMVAELGGPF